VAMNDAASNSIAILFIMNSAPQEDLWRALLLSVTLMESRTSKRLHDPLQVGRISAFSRTGAEFKLFLVPDAGRWNLGWGDGHSKNHFTWSGIAQPLTRFFFNSFGIGS